MSHVRTQIRNQAVTELLAGTTAFGSSIFSTRLYNFRNSNLPACNVYAGEESAEVATMGPGNSRIISRTLELLVDCYLEDSALDDGLDDLAVEVEKVLGATTFNRLAFDVSLINTSFDMDSNGEKPVGICTLSWQVKYHVVESDPETAM